MDDNRIAYIDDIELYKAVRHSRLEIELGNADKPACMTNDQLSRLVHRLHGAETRLLNEQMDQVRRNRVIMDAAVYGTMKPDDDEVIMEVAKVNFQLRLMNAKIERVFGLLARYDNDVFKWLTRKMECDQCNGIGVEQDGIMTCRKCLG